MTEIASVARYFMPFNSFFCIWIAIPPPPLFVSLLHAFNIAWNFFKTLFVGVVIEPCFSLTYLHRFNV